MNSVLDIYYAGKENNLIEEEDIFQAIISHLCFIRLEKPYLFKKAVLDLCQLDIFTEITQRLRYPYMRKYLKPSLV